ncbi:MAG: hypothetical protein RSC28_00845 [Bacteroidales bacterium]
MEVYNETRCNKEPLSVGQWVLTIFLLALPIVNIVMLFVWAFGGNKDERENFAKASLLWILLGGLFAVFFVACAGFAAVAGIFSAL